MTLIAVLLESDFAEESFLAKPLGSLFFSADTVLLFAVEVFEILASLSSPLVTAFFVTSTPFKSPLIEEFFFTELDRLTIGKLGSLSAFLWFGPTDDLRDLSRLSDSDEDSLNLLLGEGDLSLRLKPGDGLLDLRSIWLPM